MPRFSGKTEDWPIWSQKFLVGAKRKGYKDLLLGKTAIPKDSEVGTTDEEKKEVTVTKDLNEIAYEESVLAIDTTKKEGQVAFEHI